MPIRWKRSICIALGSLLAALALSGCGGAHCPDPTPLDDAARYPEMSTSSGRSYYGLARNAWVYNQRMTAFLREAFATDGVDGLVSKLQFQCKPHPGEGSCVECHTCARTIPVRFNDLWVLRSICTDSSPVFVQAYIGPGRAVRAMTYWPDPNDSPR
ncbi:MAG: hypothetical protein ACT4O6_08770 [Reyranella sp.]